MCRSPRNVLISTASTAAEDGVAIVAATVVATVAGRPDSIPTLVVVEGKPLHKCTLVITLLTFRMKGPRTWLLDSPIWTSLLRLFLSYALVVPISCCSDEPLFSAYCNKCVPSQVFATNTVLATVIRECALSV